MAAAWSAADPYRALARRFDAVPPDDAEAAFVAASEVLGAVGWVEAMLAPLIAALAGDAAFQPPFKVHRDGLRIGAVLFEHPAVTIGASVLSADALAGAPTLRTVVVPGRLAAVRYHRAGGACWRHWTAGPVAAGFSADAAPPCRRLPDRSLVDGAVVRQDGRTDGGMLHGPRGDVTMLTATIRYAPAAVMREYDLASGALVRAATLDEADSRTAMLLALLRVSGRHDAGEAFDAASRAVAFDLRWTAMREWLALDLRAALPRLRAMAADDPHDEVRAAARVTLLAADARLAAAPSGRIAA